MKRQDALLGAVGVAGALVGAGCVSDDEAVARDAGADPTSVTASPSAADFRTTPAAATDGRASTARGTTAARRTRTHAATPLEPSTGTSTVGRTPATAPTPTVTPRGVRGQPSTATRTGTPRTAPSRTPTEASASAETPTSAETQTRTEAPTGTPTASPTPSRPPRERVFATYDASDQYGSDVIRFRVENANEYTVRVTLSATWWHSDGTVALERTSHELHPYGTWEGDVSNSSGDASVSRWDASVESVTRV